MYFMCFYCIHSILPSAFLFLPTPYPPNLCLFLILQRKSVLPKYALMYGLLLQSDQPTRSYTLREDCLSLSQQLTIELLWASVPSCFPLLGFLWLGLSQAWYTLSPLLSANVLLCPEDDVPAQSPQPLPLTLFQFFFSDP